jgi:5'-3' exonuclease
MGDTSDNIPSVFPKCGIKTAIKCVEDSEYFNKKMANNEEYHKQYELNNCLVNFEKIPKHFESEFIDKYINF